MSEFRRKVSSILIDRAALDEQIEEFFDEVLDDLEAVHEAIIAARLAPIEALADRWAQEARERGDDDQILTAGVADMLRAALTAVRANLPVVDGADGGGA